MSDILDEINKSSGSIYNFRNADKEDDTSMVMGVYMQSLSLTVWSNRKAIHKFAFGRDTYQLIHGLTKILENKTPNYKYSLNFNKWNMEEKKNEHQATLVFGRDDKSIPFFGISGKFGKKAKFPLRMPLKYDISHECDAVEAADIEVRNLINILTTQASIALGMTPRPQAPGKGGNGGGGSKPNTSSKVSDIDDSIDF